MNKKTIILIIVGGLLVAGVIYFLPKDFFKLPSLPTPTPLASPSPNANEEIIYFYGQGCPHCAIVDEFLKANKIEEKVSFVKKEVYSNQENSAELMAKAQICNLPQDRIGIPFLWDGSQCLTGDTDVINFFKAKAGL